MTHLSALALSQNIVGSDDTTANSSARSNPMLPYLSSDSRKWAVVTTQGEKSSYSSVVLLQGHRLLLSGARFPSAVPLYCPGAHLRRWQPRPPHPGVLKARRVRKSLGCQNGKGLRRSANPPTER